MQVHLEFFLLAFTSFFTMVNPLGVIPIYNTMTAQMDAVVAKKTAARAVLTALLTMLIFAFTGKFIFDFFNISVHSLRIVGGIIFFMAGYDMLQARIMRTKADTQTEKEFARDIAITPLGIPLICGPGAMTIAIILMKDSQTIIQKLIVVAAILIVSVVTLLFLLGSRKVMKFLGESGNKVLTRIMGLIVMVIAVEFLFAGLRYHVKALFK